MRNSPTKPLSMGRPMAAREVMTNMVTTQGSFAARPPYSYMLVGAVALVEQAHEHEERGAGEALVEDLVDAAVEAGDGEGEDAEDDDADVAEGGVGGEPLEVVLHQREQGAVDDADGAERDEQRRDAVRLGGEDGEGEAQDGVEAGFAGEDHDGSGGGFDDGVDQPAVQGEDGDLDREGEEEGERGDPERGGAGRDGVLRGERGERGQVEGGGLRVEPEDGDQQKRGGDEGVEEVFDGGAAALFGAAEGGDEDGHRHQRHLPEGVVEEHVERDEDAKHRDLLQQEEDVEELLAAVDGVPGDEHAERGEQAGEDDEPHGEAVDAEVVVDDGRGDPGDVLLELEGAGRRRRRSSGRADGE